MRLKQIPLLFWTFIFSSCAMTTGEKMSQINPDMTKEEVISTLGRFDGYKKYGEYEVLSYNHRYASEWAHDRADYNVIMKDNKVVEWGQGEVRVKEMGGVQTVILLTP